MKEIWRPVEGYEGLYEVSNYGRVKSLHYGKQRILKYGKTLDGYLQVVLTKNGKGISKTIHTLVYKTFVGPIPTDYQVNHIDENKNNNCVWNLNLLTHKENSNWGTRNKRMSESLKNHKSTSKRVLCVETGIIYPSINECARQLGLPNQHIGKVCLGKRKTCGGYHFEFVN